MIKHNQQELFSALGLAKVVVDLKSSMPILRHVVVGPGGVQATDLSCWINFPLNGKGAGLVVAPLAGLMVLVEPEGKKGKGTGTVILSKNGGQLTISTPEVDGGLSSLPTEDWPADPQGILWGESQTAKVEDLIPPLDYVAPAMNPDSTRLRQHQVLIRDGKVMATDGHRAGQADVPLSIAVQIPSPSLLKILALLKKEKCGEAQWTTGTRAVERTGAGKTVIEQESWLRLTCGWELICKCNPLADPDYRFPPVEKIVPSLDGTAALVTVDVAKVQAVLKRLGKLRDPSVEYVELDLQPGELRISEKSEDRQVSMVVPARVEGQTAGIPARSGHEAIPAGSPVGFNRRYLADGLPDEGMVVELRFTDPHSGMRVDYPGRLAVLMPMRL